MADFILQKLRHMVRVSPLGPWKARRKLKKLEVSYLKVLAEERNEVPAVASGRLSPTLQRLAPRRILYIGDISWERHELLPEIRRICPVDELDLNPFVRSIKDSECSPVVTMAVECYSGLDPDLVFFYGRPGLLSEELFDSMKKRWSCPVLGMNLDDRIQFHPHGIQAVGRDNYGKFCRQFDLNLTSCRVAESWYRAAGANVLFVPQGFSRKTSTDCPPDSSQFARTIAFVGSYKQERGRLLEHLANTGIKTEIFGSGWPDGKWIDDPVTIFRSTQINLGIGYILASAGITSLKGRDTECPATGACYLTTYHWELPELYEIGKEILCYRNVEELIELYSYYSRRPEECLAIARRAHSRARAEHTWESRFRKVLLELGFCV